MTRIHGWIPILIMIGLGAGFGAFNVLLSFLLGPNKPTPEKLAPYECGMPPVGDARERHPVQFYLVAMIFLLFDIEVAFLYPFAMALRGLGWPGFFQLLCRLHADHWLRPLVVLGSIALSVWFPST